MYAKWDDSTWWYLAQVISLDVDSKKYSLHFMDGYSKENVVERKLRKVPDRETKGKPIGKKFFDRGDYIPGDRSRTTTFKKGEFIVLCYQPRSGSSSASYWCERITGVGSGGKRVIEEFGVSYVHKLIRDYESE